MTVNSLNTSSVYGPVDSWRLGKSLGVDLIMDTSTCSFNCTYCQLGFIQKTTSQRNLFVSTEKVIADFKKSNWMDSDIITFSGSGEPTLALNLGEVICKIKEIIKNNLPFKSIPIGILTNGTLLNDPDVRNDVLKVDIISVKLDAINDTVLNLINRPIPGINLNSILEGIEKLKEDINHVESCHGMTLHSKILQIQVMFMPQNKDKISDFAILLNKIKPDEVALNTPTRPYPSGWDIITRGAHGEDAKKIKYPVKPLKILTKDEAFQIESKLKELTGLKVISVYKP